MNAKFKSEFEESKKLLNEKYSKKNYPEKKMNV
jgi:hypothetical protein